MSEEKNNKQKRGSAVDKLVMGAIIGGAIGSVIGASMLPKKAKEKTGVKKILLKGIKKVFGKKAQKEIPNE